MLSGATKTIFSIAEVYESHKPYGILPGDPPTYVSTVRTANCIKNTCNVPPTTQATIDAARSNLKAIQMAEKCFILDMKRAIASDESILQETCWYVTHRFKTHLPLPEFWAEEYPTVVVLWPALQKQQILADIWCQWAMTQRLHTWTDVTEITIFSFFQDLQVFLPGLIAPMHRALPLSLSLWTTLNRVFGCTVCWEGSPLGPHANVSAAPTEDLKPFMVPTPAEPQTYCVYPRLTQVRQGSFPDACWDCTTIIDFLQSRLSPLNCGMAKDAIILAPTVSTARCLLETRRAQGTALLIASDVRFQKMFTHWPHQNLCDESLGQWWWVSASPEVMSRLRVYSHDFVKLFGGMVHQHGAPIHLPPSPIVSVSVYPHSFSKYFRYVIDTETQIRAQGLHAKWNFKTRRLNTRFDWRLNTRFDWTAIPRSWDTVNKSIQWSNCKLGRLIHMWRMTDRSVSESGSWIYALWIPGYNKVYVGQTRARGVYRSVFDRGKEHIIQARLGTDAPGETCSSTIV